MTRSGRKGAGSAAATGAGAANLYAGIERPCSPGGHPWYEPERGISLGYDCRAFEKHLKRWRWACPFCHGPRDPSGRLRDGDPNQFQLWGDFRARAYVRNPDACRPHERLRVQWVQVCSPRCAEEMTAITETYQAMQFLAQLGEDAL